MKRLMMSLVAVVMLSSVASAKTAATTTNGNARVKTTSQRLANNTVRVTEETTETNPAFVRCNFKVSIYSCDGVLLGSAVFTDYASSASGCASFFAAMHDWVANN
ncbi:hypothetical protein ACLCDV_10505 [Sphingobacterium sp. Lzh-3]|jgi:acid phosphatase class B|uniref:hypothetical protein n=1 Tax=Sphingobacterium TaxID=28453 RepID=UPI002954B431|nr:hypothetical protein [Sphingobacterium sp. UGAL515B_05]WON94170.1 hypothetical protein OK025_23355 [Sphingobacterium sp. UGAL515B_05]